MTRIAFMSKYSGKYKLVVNEINLCEEHFFTVNRCDYFLVYRLLKMAPSWNCVDVMRVPWYQPFSYNIGKRNSNFQFRFSFTHDVGKRNSNFYLPVSFFYYTENESGSSVFVFRFFPLLRSTKLQLSFSVFHLVFVWH